MKRYARQKRLDTNGHTLYLLGTLLADEHIEMWWMLQEPVVKKKSIIQGRIAIAKLSPKS